MNRYEQISMLLLTFWVAITVTGCELAGDIFKAGAWTGVILVVGGIVLVIWVVSKLFGGSRNNS
jgi:hypothetical protein